MHSDLHTRTCCAPNGIANFGEFANGQMQNDSLLQILQPHGSVLMVQRTSQQRHHSSSVNNAQQQRSALVLERGLQPTGNPGHCYGRLTEPMSHGEYRSAHPAHAVGLCFIAAGRASTSAD